MKLTESQIQALKAVEAGKVKLVCTTESIYQSFVVGRVDPQDIRELTRVGLVVEPVLSWGKREADFSLPPVGRKVLADLRRGGKLKE